MAIWNLLDCGLCGMLLDRQHWLRGRPRATHLREMAERHARWKRMGFWQASGRRATDQEVVEAGRKRRPKGIQIIDVCAMCARRKREELEQEYRRRFVGPGGPYLESWDD